MNERLSATMFHLASQLLSEVGCREPLLLLAYDENFVPWLNRSRFLPLTHYQQVPATTIPQELQCRFQLFCRETGILGLGGEVAELVAWCGETYHVQQCQNPCFLIFERDLFSEVLRPDLLLTI
jgi:hypothetical protein